MVHVWGLHVSVLCSFVMVIAFCKDIDQLEATIGTSGKPDQDGAKTQDFSALFSRPRRFVGYDNSMERLLQTGDFSMPTQVPSPSPTESEALSPTLPPSTMPTNSPTIRPTDTPTGSPSSTPPTVCEPPITLAQRRVLLLDIVDDISAFAQLMMPGSDQFLAFEWLVETDPAMVCPEEELDVIQRYVMAAFFFSTMGMTWNQCGGIGSPCPGVPFLSGQNVCDWQGVTCTIANGVIQGLAIADNNLGGTLPSELGSLANLVVIDLNQNFLGGRIPLTFGNLDQLEILDLDNNLLMGPIPEELYNAQRLVELELMMNGISGTISTRIGQLLNLERFQLDSNDLMGSIPTEIGELSKLTFFVAAGNSLTGTIPTEFQRNTALEALSLQSNNITGAIPSQLGVLSGLMVLNLFENSLTGNVPAEFGMLTNAVSIILHRNCLNGDMPMQVCALNGFQLSQLTADCALAIGGTLNCPTSCCACFANPLKVS